MADKAGRSETRAAQLVIGIVALSLYAIGLAFGDRHAAPPDPGDLVDFRGASTLKGPGTCALFNQAKPLQRFCSDDGTCFARVYAICAMNNVGTLR